MFNEISQIVGTPYENAIGSTAIKVRRLARRKKGAKTRPFAEAFAPPKKLLADKAYAAFRDWLSRHQAGHCNKINRRKPYPHNKRAYRHRNKIERMFCRLKDARRIATRDEKCANNFLSVVCLVALISFWLNSVRTLVDFIGAPGEIRTPGP
jgi:hypothetical protein